MVAYASLAGNDFELGPVRFSAMSKTKTTNGLMHRLQSAFARLVGSGTNARSRNGRRLAPLQELEDRCLLSVTPLGSQYLVNTYTQGAQQTFPSTPQAVAMNKATGAYVVVWSSQGQNAGGGYDVYFQRFNAAGVAQGSETLVNTPISGVNQQYANVAMNSSGSFVVTWSSQAGGHWNIYAQQYNASGVALGLPILVDTPASQDQEYSTVAINSAGNFVVTWSGQQSGQWQIYANVFNSSGVSQTGPIQITSATSQQTQPDVALSDNGNFVITWTGQGQHLSVYAEMFGSNNLPAGSAFQINTNTTDDQEDPAIAMDASGNFTIVWSGHQGGHFNIYAQSYLANGTANGSNFQVNPSTGQDQEDDSIAFAGSADPIITWSSNNQDGSGWGVYAQQVTPTGTLLGSEVQANTYTQDNQFYSSVAGAANGNVTIVWTSNNEINNLDVFGQNYNAGVSPGFTVTPISIQTSMSGASASFSVALTSEPLAPVTINLNNGNPTDGTLSTNALTFTASNWNVAQSITVTGRPDLLAGTNVAYQITGTATSGDANYNGMAMTPVTVTNVDTTQPGFIVNPTALTTSQSGASASFTVALSTLPFFPVTVNLTNGAPTEGSLSQSSLTFSLLDWNTPQTVTVTGLDDHIADGNQTYQITGTATSLDPTYNAMTITPVSVTNVQTDVAGISVTPTSIQTSMSGASASFSVALTSQPLAPVTITLTNGDPTDGTLTTNTLTFTAGNWNVAQTVTVTGLNDPLAGANVTYQITGTATSTDANYNGMAMTPVSVTNVDNTLPGFVVNPTTLTTSQSGATASFSVALTTLPAASVTINLTNGDPTQGSLSQSSLTFTTANWNSAQTVTVTGLNDNVANGNQTYQITGTATSTDSNYNNLAMTPVTVTNTQTDVAGINVTGSTFLVVEDNNLVRVNAKTGAVVVTYATGLANDGLAVGSDGSFYVADYYNNQIDHFSAAGNLLGSFGSSELITPQGLTFGPNGNLFVTCTNGPNNGFVDEFSPSGTFIGTFISAGSGGLSNAKDIVWGPDGNAYVSGYDYSQVLEYNGTTGAFIKVFATGSGGFEQIAFGPDGNLYAASYGNNAVERFNGTTGASMGVFVTGISTPYGLFFDPAGNLDVSSRSTGDLLTYNGVTGASIGTLDTGLANPAYFSATTSLVTSDTGTSATYSVTLTSAPLAPVTINLGTTEAGQGSLSQASLTFDASNWNVAQTVTVTGLNDHIADGAQTYLITGAATSTDVNYNGVAMAPVAVTNLNTNVAGITVAPTSIQTSMSGASASFSLALTSAPVAPVTITLTNGDPTDGTLSTNTLTFNASDWNVAQSVTVTGQNDALAGANVTFQITGTATSGDANYNNVALTPVTVTNVDTNTSTSISSSGSPSMYGQAVTFTATVNAVVSATGTPTGTITFVDGLTDLATVSLSGGSAVYTTSALSAGSHDITANYSGDSTFLTGTSTTLTQGVTPAALTITADNASKTYGQTLTFAGTAFTTSGLVNSDSVSSVTLASAGAAATATVSGSPYAITASAATGTGLGNYTISYVNGSLTVNPATLTVTADNATKAYGQPNPSLTDTITGFVNGENAGVVSGSPSLGTTATASSGVGSYSITAAQGSLSATNYTFAFANGTLTITPVAMATPLPPSTPPTLTGAIVLMPVTPPGSSASGATDVAASASPSHSTALVSTALFLGGTAPNSSANDVTMDSSLTLISGVDSATRTIQVFSPIPQSAWREAPIVSALEAAETPVDVLISRLSTASTPSAQARAAQADDGLDVLNDDGERVPWTEPGLETTMVLGTGAIAASGYVLLNSRLGLWLLGLLTSQPLWKQFDPLDVLYAWENEDRVTEDQEEETLLSLVD
jgi:hypothetical protein